MLCYHSQTPNPSVPSGTLLVLFKLNACTAPGSLRTILNSSQPEWGKNTYGIVESLEKSRVVYSRVCALHLPVPHLSQTISLSKCDGLWLGLPLQLLNFEFGPGPVHKPDTDSFLIPEVCTVSLFILYLSDLIHHISQRHGLYKVPFLFRTSLRLSIITNVNHFPAVSW